MAPSKKREQHEELVRIILEVARLEADARERVNALAEKKLKERRKAVSYDRYNVIRKEKELLIFKGDTIEKMELKPYSNGRPHTQSCVA